VSGVVVAVGGILFDDQERVLLIERAHDPGRGLWTVPGGRVELGEPHQETCRREMREETGLEVEVGPLCEVLDRIQHGSDRQIEHHFVILDYLVRATGGHLRPGGDARACEFVALDALAKRPTTLGLAPVLARALQHKRTWF
jgi:ADP-ribose pyrophosphatase YjhB (NUDIX family)